jgi:hypothetical protein
MTAGVFLDRAFKHTPTWAVVWNDVLLPVRFGTELEARTHLFGLVHGHVIPAAHLPVDVQMETSVRHNGKSSA